MGIEIQNVMAVVMMDLVQLGRGHLSESHATTCLKSSKKCRNTPTRAEKQSVQHMARPAVCIKRNHFQTVCTSKDKAKSRNMNRLDENKVYDDKSSAGDEKHTFLLSIRQSSKNQPFLKSNQGVVRVWGDAVLHYFWRGFAKIFILSCGIAVFQDQVVFVFYQFGKFRCAIYGIKYSFSLAI